MYILFLKWHKVKPILLKLIQWLQTNIFMSVNLGSCKVRLKLLKHILTQLEKRVFHKMSPCMHQIYIICSPSLTSFQWLNWSVIPFCIHGIACISTVIENYRYSDFEVCLVRMNGRESWTRCWDLNCLSCLYFFVLKRIQFRLAVLWVTFY